MKSDSSWFHRFKIDLILIAILAVGALAWGIHRHPFTLSTSDPFAAAVMPQQLGQSSILLVLPDNAPTAESFPGYDFSFAWYNALSQTFGPFSIALVRDIQSAQDLRAQLIVIPQKTAEAFSESQIQLVSQAVQQGASLVIEMPPPEWAPLTGTKRRTKGSSAIKRLTDAPNSPLTSTWREQLLNIPLDTQVLRIDSLDAEPLSSDSLLLEIDGGIAHYRRPVGAGFVFVLAFNFGQAVTALQQGRPGDALSIETEQPPRTSDLVLNDKMRANTVPYADLLKTHVFGAIAQTTPVPMLWPFPNAQKAALILSHSTGALSDDAFLAATPEIEAGVRTSWFVTPGKISPDALRRAAEKLDIGVSLVRPPVGRIYKKIGPDFFQPVAVERSMAEQKTALSRSLQKNITACKIAQNAWSHDYTAAFRRLAAATCKLDLSYGPTHAQEFGYLFGSGFPFLPIEKNGLPLSTYELPTLIDDAVGLETLPEEAPIHLLKDALNTYHQPVTVHFDADTMLTHPSYLAPQTYADLLDFARTHDVWTTSAEQFLFYFTTRKLARLLYAFHPQSRTLDVDANLPNAPFDYTLALPRRSAPGTLHALWLDKNSVDVDALRPTADGLFLLIPVPPGAHAIQAHYQ